MTKPIVTYYDRPGLWMSEPEQRSFINELRTVAAAALQVDLSQIPSYQCLALDDPLVLSDKLIAVGRSPSTGCMLGFISSVLVDIPTFAVGEVIHIGLACLSPSEPHTGLSKRMMSTIIYNHLRAHPSVKKVWITNRSCTLSTLGLFAQTFDQVFPSPEHPSTPPTPEHLAIAEAIVTSTSRSISVAPGQLDARTFLVSKGLLPKSRMAENLRNDRYRQASPEMWEFYSNYLDEARNNAARSTGVSPIIQVGHFNSRILYILRSILPTSKL